MRCPWNSGVSVAFVLSALLALAVPAAAYHTGSTQTVSFQVGENVDLPINNWTGYTFTIATGDQIQYGIQSTSDGIDIFFFDAAGLAQYRADPPQTTQAISSFLNRTQFGGVYTPPSGQITLVIDNVDASGAMPLGTVTVQVALVKLTGGAPPDVFAGIIAAGIILCVGAIAIIVFVIFLIVWLVTRSHRPPMPPPPPPYMPPQQPWPPPQQPPQQPPQGGNPPDQWPPQNP